MSENKTENAIDVITNVIKIKNNQEQKKITKNCPDCDRIQIYNCVKARKTAEKKNTRCKICANLGAKNPNFGKQCPDHVKKILRDIHTNRVVSDQTREKHRQLMLGEKNPMYGRLGKDCPAFGRTKTKEERNFLSKCRKGKKVSNEHRLKIIQGLIGRKHSEETKEKQRIAALKRVIQSAGCISYNKTACLIFDEINRELKWNGRHALNGGEFSILGYSIDYYEPTLNIAIEYDEANHYLDGKLKDKDIERQNKIVKHLDCKFYRIQYNKNWKEILRQYV